MGRQQKKSVYASHVMLIQSWIVEALKRQSVLPLGLTAGLLLAMFSMEMNSGQAHAKTLSPNKSMSTPEQTDRPTIPYSISVVLPAYNEEAIIQETITAVAMALKNWTADFEIVVVNDGSKDKTKDIVERLVRSEPHVCLLDTFQRTAGMDLL